MIFTLVADIKKTVLIGFPDGAKVKIPPANTGDAGSVFRLERSPGGESDNSLQYSCLKSFMGRGAWRAIAHNSRT